MPEQKYVDVRDEEELTYFDGTGMRCKTCMTVIGSIGESKQCHSPCHRHPVPIPQPQEIEGTVDE